MITNKELVTGPTTICFIGNISICIHLLPFFRISWKIRPRSRRSHAGLGLVVPMAKGPAVEQPGHHAGRAGAGGGRALTVVAVHGGARGPPWVWPGVRFCTP